MKTNLVKIKQSKDYLNNNSARGNSILFIVITASFILLFYSGLFFMSTTSGAMEKLNTDVAATNMLSTLELAVPVAQSANLSGVEHSSIPKLFEPGSAAVHNDESLIPFVLDANYSPLKGSSLPENVSLKLASKLTEGDFKLKVVDNLQNPVMLCMLENEGRTWLTSVVRLNDSVHYLGFARDLTPLIKSAQFLQRQFIGILAVAYVIFITLLFLVLKIVTSPLKRLTTAAIKFADGDFNVRVKNPRMINEVNVLTDAFNTMGERLFIQTNSLAAYSRELEEANKKRGDALSELSSRNRELAAMNETAMLANKLDNPDHIIEITLRRLFDDLELVFCNIYELNNSGSFVLKKLQGLPSPSDSSPSQTTCNLMRKCLDNLSMQRMSSALLNSFDESIDKSAPSDFSAFDDRLYVPIFIKNQTYGVIELISQKSDFFNDEIQSFVRHFIAHMEVILRNKSLYTETSRRTHELEKLNQVTRMISSELDTEHLFTEVVDHTLSTIHADCAFIALLDDDLLKIRSITPVIKDLDILTLELTNDVILREIISFGRPIIIGDLNRDERVPSDSFYRSTGYNSFVGQPIVNKDKVIGVLCGCSENSRAFGESDSYFLSLLAGQLGIAIDNARMFHEILSRDKRRDEQLSMGRKLQQDRIPNYFKQNIAAVNCLLSPADELAGDFFDVFSLGRNSLAIVIGDVANKGVAASLMTFSLLSMFRNNARTLRPPCEILDGINRSLIAQIKDDCWFATCFYAKLNTRTRTLTYSSAGHELPIWFHADTGEAEKLTATGYPLGLFSSFSYETKEISLNQGDKLIFYTDGIPDATNSNGERFGYESLFNLIKENGNLTGEELSQIILDKIHEFTGDRRQRDDILIAVLDLQDDPWVHRSITFKNSAEIVNDILQALNPYELDQSIVYAIRLSVDEALANAWRHGLQQDDNVEFDVSYLISDEGFQMRVKDSGRGFDHESLPDPTVEENLLKTHGRGVFLIRQFMDEVEFNDTGNEIILSKNFPNSIDSQINDGDLILDSKLESMRQQESLEAAKKAGNEADVDDDPDAIMNAFLKSIGESDT